MRGKNDPTSDELEAHIDRLTRENEMLKGLVLNSLPCVLFALDRDGFFTLAEGSGLQKLGSEPGEWVGRNALEDWRGTAAEGQMRRALAGEAFQSTLAIPGRLHYDVWYAPIQGAQGQVDGVLAFAIEVTAERLREAALREELEEESLKQQRLQQLERALSSAPVALWAFDRDGTCTLSEGKALRALGFEPGEAVGFNASDMFEQQPLTVHLRAALSGRASTLVAEVGSGAVLYSWCLPLIDAGTGRSTGAVMFGVDALGRSQAARESVSAPTCRDSLPAQ
ncbi:MAG: PAS domain-containing protein [Polyangiaceae bacterium]